MGFIRRRNYNKALELSRLRAVILRHQNGLCAICGQRILVGPKGAAPNPDVASLDHVIPWSFGGKDEPGNFVVTHFICNQVKADTFPTGCTLIWLMAVNARLGWSPVRW